jgi:hypothetical protein
VARPGLFERINMKKRKWILPVVAVISLFLLLASVSVDAQETKGYNEDDWTDQCELVILGHESTKTFRADGVDKAKMRIGIAEKDKKAIEPSELVLCKAQSDVTVILISENGTVKPQNVTIPKGNIVSEDISLTSTQPGIASITAMAANFNATGTSIKFATPPKPCVLYLDAIPKENITANGSALVRLTAKLLDKNGEPFKPYEDRKIDTWTDRGEGGPQIIISKNMLYGQGRFGTYKWGHSKITAISHDFNLTCNTVATFNPTIILPNIILALLGGFLGGFMKYYYEYKKGILFWPKKQKNGTYRLGMVGHSTINAFGGLIVYMGACYDVPFTNILGLPVEIGPSVFIIGLIGGLYGSIIISGLGKLINLVIGG